MKLASIEIIQEILPHPNADFLEICRVLNYQCIVKKGEYKVSQAIVFIQPDTILPEKEWAAFYKAKSNRVRAIRLRGVWSEGIIENPKNLGLPYDFVGMSIGVDISDIINVKKYELPEPQDLKAKGYLPFNLPTTDEERYQNISIPYGQIIDVTLKMDGKSFSAYAIQDNNTWNTWHTGICSRRLEYKLESLNDFTKFQNILEPLKSLAIEFDKSIVIRGEITGEKIQSCKYNPHCKGEKQLSIFSVYLPEEHRYTCPNEDLYYQKVAEKLSLKTVPLLEKSVILTPELIKKYSEDLTQINGNYFEGVVIKGNGFSFKIINKFYDSLK